MKNLILIVFVISFLACDKKDEIVEEQQNIDILFELSVFNSDNEDLLDTATSGHIVESEIKLFYEVDGEIVEVYNANYTFPRNYLVYKHEDEYRIRVFMNHSESAERPITYIKWTDDDSDTLKAEFERPGGSILKRYVWFNDLEVWDWTLNEEEHYRIEK